MIQTIEDLYRVNIDRKHLSHQIYRTLYTDVMTKIKQKNDAYTYNMIYKPPSVVMGNIRYNKKTCGLYLMKKLTAAGFIVLPYTDNLFYIDWSFTTNRSAATPALKKVTFK